jgi:hypothetical protein
MLFVYIEMFNEESKEGPFFFLLLLLFAIAMNLASLLFVCSYWVLFFMNIFPSHFSSSYMIVCTFGN